MTTSVFAIDDNAHFLATLALVVEATEGFELIGTASSAEAALGSLRLDRADLVLVDFELPGMNGLEFARELRLDEGINDLTATESDSGAIDPPVVVVMSSYAIDELPAASLLWRLVEGFLPKARLSPATLRKSWSRRSTAEAKSTGEKGRRRTVEPG